MEQRKLAARSESHFIRFVITLSLLATLVVFVIIYVFSGQLAAAAETTPENDLTAPVLGNFSLIDIAGFIFVAIAGYAVYRRFRNKN